MDIERLIALCPRYSKVVLHANTDRDDTYSFASSGDVIVLHECAAGEPTGRTLTALVIGHCQQARTAPDCTGSEPTKPPSLAECTSRCSLPERPMVAEVCSKVRDR